ncbi:MAG: hypothetical protein JRK26_11310 [Deltaproteobacteria bacterium]|nr:hypothetical protein [Deltaproteobacteria bacterium]
MSFANNKKLPSVAVVTKNVSDHALVAGNPATQIGACGEKLADDLSCSYCNKAYRKAKFGFTVC